MKQYLHYDYDKNKIFISPMNNKIVVSHATGEIYSLGNMSIADREQMMLFGMSQVYQDLRKAIKYFNIDYASFVSVSGLAYILIMMSIDANVYSISFGNILHIYQSMNDNNSDLLVDYYKQSKQSIVSRYYTKESGERVKYEDMYLVHLLKAFETKYYECAEDENDMGKYVLWITNNKSAIARAITISTMFTDLVHTFNDETFYIYEEIVRRVDNIKIYDNKET